MIDDDASTERDPLDLLVEQFLLRQRRGELVSVEAFASEHETHGDALRDLLPTLLALERVKRERESTGGQKARVPLVAMQRLGDFRIVREIGRGGMGVVFEAVQESLSRKVALKVLPQAALLTGNQLSRFQREAQIAAQLHHSNIVPVFGSGESDGYHWYAMQFIDGVGLDAWRATESGKPEVSSGQWRDRGRFVATAGEQVASALRYAHAQGTLHRDIKPANLLLEQSGHVWITDFGLAKALEAEGLTHSGDLLGTLQYMAPEQFTGHYDQQSEVYALGVTLYELATLRPAYAGKTKSELMEAIRTGRPAPLRRLCPDVPEDLAIIIEKAIARDAGDRYESAAAIQHDLQAFLEDRPIAARRQAAVALLWRWCRRNRAIASFAAAALLAAVAAGVTGWVAYVTTDAALRREQTANEKEAQQSRRAESNLKLALVAFGDVFDALVGRDPVLMFEDDPDTGEQSVIVARQVDPKDLALLDKMLRFYDEFVAQNVESQSLRFDTARAYRRMGVIQARLGRLEEAATAYDRALERYQDVTDRDVTREIAAVHVDYGQLEQRRGSLPEASAARFGLALRLLDGEPSTGDSKALRFDRAHAHFLLARNSDFRGPGRGSGGGGRPSEGRPSDGRPNEGPPGDRRPGDRPPADRAPGDRSQDQRAVRREFDRKRAEGREHLDVAREILAGLLAEEPAMPEFKALEARCLLLSSRLRLPGEAGYRSDAAAGIAILQELVASHVDAVHFRYELCDALLTAIPAASGLEGELAVLRQARTHAEELVRQQPTWDEALALRGRVAAQLGSKLMLPSPDLAEGLAERRQEAELELRLARSAEQSALDSGRIDRRRFLQVIRTGAVLDRLLRDTGRVVEADAELDKLFASLGKVAVTNERSGRGDSGQGGGRWSGPGRMFEGREGRDERWVSEEFLRRLRPLNEARVEPGRGGR